MPSAPGGESVRHANARINAAVREQLEELEQVILAGFTHEPVIALSEALSALAPAGLTAASTPTTAPRPSRWR